MSLLTNISIDITLRMPFITISNVKIDFVDRHIYWKIYIIAKILPMTKRVKLIGKKEFAYIAIDL